MEMTTLQMSDDTHTVQPRCGALVARNAADFAVALMPMRRRGLRLEIDLSLLRHVDSAGVGALLTCSHALQREGCEMVLTRVEPNLQDELQACGLERLLARSGEPARMAF
jgi:anti-anti-sigma factor